MKLYVTNGSESGKENLDGIYYLITEDGEALYSHWCSNKYFAIDDLIEGRPERQKECKERFGEYKVLYLGDDGMTQDRLFDLNKKFFEL